MKNELKEEYYVGGNGYLWSDKRFDDRCKQNVRIEEKNVRIEEKNARIGEKNARIGEKNARIE